jgi:hypothetical protein
LTDPPPAAPGATDSPFSQGLILDPAARAREKERRRLRFNRQQVPVLRLVGFLLLALSVVFYNSAFAVPHPFAKSLFFFAAGLIYSLASWAALFFLYPLRRTPFHRIDLGDVFLVTDIFFHILVIHLTGGPDSLFIILLVTRVADQANTRFRRVLLFSHLEILGYVGLLLFLESSGEQAVPWKREAVKILVVYLFNFYVCLTARTAERMRVRQKAAIRRANAELVRRREAEAALQRRNRELETALDEIKVLRGIVPICSYCKKIRDDRGYWNQLESYLRAHSEAEFSHGICPDCVQRYFPDMADDLEGK